MRRACSSRSAAIGVTRIVPDALVRAEVRVGLGDEQGTNALTPGSRWASTRECGRDAARRR